MKNHRQLNDFTGSDTKDNRLSVVSQVIASMGKAEPSLDQQLAAAKADIAELYFWLRHGHAWLDINADYKDSPMCEKITKTLAKHEVK